MISVVLATHNEELNLARCLDSIKAFADEIIIADGESADKTVLIAQKYHAKVIQTTNKQVFHINKQIAMDAAKGDLILQLDADEVVDDGLRNFIIKLHASLFGKKKISEQNTKLIDSTEPVAWYLKRKNYLLGRFLKKGGQYPDPVIRLYIRGYAHLPQKDVHEQMVVNGKVGWAEGHLLHYSYPNFATYMRKWNDYTSLKATQLKEANRQLTAVSFFEYVLIKPITTFFSLYFRHKGFIDRWPGFVFALMSALYFPMSYLKLWELYVKKN